MTSYEERPVKVSIYPVVPEGQTQDFPTLTLGNITLSVEAIPTPSGRLKVEDANLYRAMAAVLTEAAEQLVSWAVDAEFESLRERFE